MSQRAGYCLLNSNRRESNSALYDLENLIFARQLPALYNRWPDLAVYNPVLRVSDERL